MTRSEKYTVYELYAVNGDVLYVGCTCNLDQRLGTHMKSKAWWPEVARIDSTEYDGRAAGLVAERDRIRELNPPHNSVYTDHPADAWAGRLAKAAERHGRGEMCQPWFGCKECNRAYGPTVRKRLDWRQHMRAVLAARESAA